MSKNYSKSGDKELSSKTGDMIKAGGSGGDNSGVTGSSRSYPKGSSVSMKADFTPMKGKRTGTDWAVGGC